MDLPAFCVTAIRARAPHLKRLVEEVAHFHLKGSKDPISVDDVRAFWARRGDPVTHLWFLIGALSVKGKAALMAVAHEAFGPEVDRMIQRLDLGVLNTADVNGAMMDDRAPYLLKMVTPLWGEDPTVPEHPECEKYKVGDAGSAGQSFG